MILTQQPLYAANTHEPFGVSNCDATRKYRFELFFWIFRSRCGILIIGVTEHAIGGREFVCLLVPGKEVILYV